MVKLRLTKTITFHTLYVEALVRSYQTIQYHHQFTSSSFPTIYQMILGIAQSFHRFRK